MDYEKEYKSLVAKVKKAHLFAQTDSTKKVLEDILPQLRESEDEQSHKRIEQLIRLNTSGAEKTHLLAYLEKQKKQSHEDEKHTDFTIYHPLKNGKGKYECIPYSFHGSLTSFSKDKDLIDFLRTCFYTKEECNEWIEQQKQISFNESYNQNDYEVVMGGNASSLKQKEQKPAEWSEEDEDFTNMLILHFNYLISKGGDSVETYKSYIEKLKSFHPQPHWKPSEEQMDRLFSIVAALRKDYCDDMADFLASLYEQLKKLM